MALRWNQSWEPKTKAKKGACSGIFSQSRQSSAGSPNMGRYRRAAPSHDRAAIGWSHVDTDATRSPNPAEAEEAEEAEEGNSARISESEAGACRAPAVTASAEAA